MIFAPHILQKKEVVEMQRDEFGRPIPNTGGQVWVNVCLCRCDDNSTKEFSTANGIVYRPSFHIVCERGVSVKAGDEVRCVDENTNIRGEGKAFMVKNSNFFGYGEIWV